MPTNLIVQQEDNSAIHLINRLLNAAISQKISDIHLEPYETSYRVRFRQDGMLVEAVQPPLTMVGRLTTRLKVMADLDIAERRVPQDGRFKFTPDKQRQAIDVRVSTCPTLFGEKIVLRVLDPLQLSLNWKALGYDETQQQHVLNALKQPQGLILVTGPTGSGKTVSLYSALKLLSTPEKNVSSVEDPVEIYLPGINQVAVNRKAGLHFPQALRAFLRQDPDVIMVGEIRDVETAEIAIKAAQTGHLVLSTLHTNSAADTLTRLLNMGVAPFNLASAASLIIAQRLARRLCLHCKKPQVLTGVECDAIGLSAKDEYLSIYQANPRGCQHCHHGYLGRTGIFEVMPISKAIRKKMLHGRTTEIAEQAKNEGMIGLWAAGIEKVKQGIISLAELNRVISEK